MPVSSTQAPHQTSHTGTATRFSYQKPPLRPGSGNDDGPKKADGPESQFSYYRMENARVPPTQATPITIQVT
jgi:hypothetical protein